VNHIKQRLRENIENFNYQLNESQKKDVDNLLNEMLDKDSPKILKDDKYSNFISVLVIASILKDGGTIQVDSFYKKERELLHLVDEMLNLKNRVTSTDTTYSVKEKEYVELFSSNTREKVVDLFEPIVIDEPAYISM